MTPWSLKLRVDKAENIGDPSHTGNEVYLCRVAWGSTIVRTYSGSRDGYGSHTFDMLIRLPHPETERDNLQIDLLEANDPKGLSFGGLISYELIETTKNKPRLINTQLSPKGNVGLVIELVNDVVATPSVERVGEACLPISSALRAPPVPPTPQELCHPRSTLSGAHVSEHGPNMMRGIPQRKLTTLNSNLSFGDDGQQSEGGLSYVTAQHSLPGFHSPILSSEALFESGHSGSFIRRVDARRILATNTATPRYAFERSTLDIPTSRPIRLSRDTLEAIQPSTLIDPSRDPKSLTSPSLPASPSPMKSSLSSTAALPEAPSPILSRIHGQHQRSSTLGGGSFGALHSNGPAYLRTNPAATMSLRASPSTGPRSMSPAAGRRFHLPLSRIEGEASGSCIGEPRNRRTCSIASSSPVPDLKLSTSLGSNEGHSYNSTVGGMNSGPRLSPTSLCVLSCTNMAAELCTRYNAKTRFEDVTQIIQRLLQKGESAGQKATSWSRSRRVYHSYASLYLYLNRLSFISQDTNSRWRIQGQDCDENRAGMIKGITVTLDQDKRGLITMKILTPISDDEPYAHLLIPVDVSLKPLLTIALWYAERSHSQSHITIPLSSLLEHGVPGLEGSTHFFTSEGDVDPSVTVSLALKFTPYVVASTSCLMERNPRISISTLMHRGNAQDISCDQPQPTVLTSGSPTPVVSSTTSTTPLEVLIQRFNRLSVTLLSLDNKFKDLPDTINGESTDVLTCKVSLGMTAGLKSFLNQNWRTSIRNPTPHKFLYNGERILRLCLSCTKKAVVCQLRIDLHKLLRTRVATFRSAVQVTTLIESLKGAKVEILLEFTKQESSIPPSPALSWRSALEGARFLRLCIEEIRANDLSYLHKTFTMRVSCGPVKLKSRKLKVPEHEKSRMHFDHLTLDMPVTEDFLRKTEEKSIILSVYLKNEETKQNHVFQLLKLTCSYFLVPSKLPRIWNGELLLNLAPGTPSNTPRCCVRLTMIISDCTFSNLGHPGSCDTDETPRLKKETSVPSDADCLASDVPNAPIFNLGATATPEAREVTSETEAPGDIAAFSTVESLTEHQSVGAETSIDEIETSVPTRVGLLISSNTKSTLHFHLFPTEMTSPLLAETAAVSDFTCQDEEAEAPEIRQHVSKSWSEQENFRCWSVDTTRAYLLKITDEDYKDSHIHMSFPNLNIDGLKDKSWGIPINEGEAMRMSTEDGPGPVKFFRSTPGDGKNSEVVRLAIISLPSGTT